MINRIFFLVTLPILFSIQSFAGEFLVHDEIYEWGTDASEGKRSWYFDGAGPANWLTPDNYYSGQFYFRYEILSQPTSRACQMQFVIWQDWNYPTSWLEQASPLTTVYGPGSIITTNSSPATWWQYNGQPLDFSRPADFYKFGVMVWSADPSGRIAQYLADRPEVDIYDEIWADRFDWFPLQVRFTIVAVSAGSTFSGWENYVDGTTPPPPPPPPPADSCENIADSPAPGPNAVQAENMTLNNYYQQGLIGASGGMVAGLWNPNTGLSNESGSISTNFTLSDGIYDIEVVYLDENDGESPFNLKLNGTTINSWVGELQECQNKYTKITTTNVTILNGDLITIEGQKADNAFAKVDYIDFVYISDIYTDYPEFSIDYFNERTGELVTGEYQYSYNQSDWITGTDSYLTLTPGQDVYFRYVTAPANIQHLEVDGRPSAPAFTVDYSLETTLQAVSSDYQYSTAANLSGAVTGAGSSVELTPGQNLFFAAMSTETSFRSEIQTLIVPSRPSAPPAIDINFPSETTGSVIGNTIEYAVTADMVASTAGTGTAVSLVPGQDLYFRYISTVSSFASYIYHLDVPERPEGPVFTVNFVSETTNETLSPSIEFSLSAGMETPASGDGNVLDLEAATDYYFRKLPTATEFRSAVTNLQTPTRPEFLTDYTQDTTSSSVITLQLVNDSGTDGFSLSDLQLTNCTAGNLHGSNEFEIYPADYGVLYVALPANSLTGGNFTSLNYSIEYIEGPNATISYQAGVTFDIYPSPVNEYLSIRTETSGSSGDLILDIYNSLGEKVDSYVISAPLCSIHVSDYRPGMYIVTLKDGQSGILLGEDKFIKE